MLHIFLLATVLLKGSTLIMTKQLSNLALKLSMNCESNKNYLKTHTGGILIPSLLSDIFAGRKFCALKNL